MKSSDILKIENLSNTSDSYTIRWQMTYLCNYSCDFCIQGSKKQHISKSMEESKETRKKICNNIIKLIENELNGKYKEIYIYLIGGEITILKDFLEILQKFLNCSFEGRMEIHITTNLSTDKNILEELVKLLKRKYEYERYVIISASFYKDYVTEEDFMQKVGILYKKEKTIRRILRKNKLYKKLIKWRKINAKNRKRNKKGKLHVNINYPVCTDNEYKLYLKFKRKYIGRAKNINYIIIRNYSKSISEKLKNKLKKHTKQRGMLKVSTINKKVYYFLNMSAIALQLKNEKHFNPRGYLCDIGINSITISNLGIVSRCLACPDKTTIGDMKTGILNKLPTEKLICTLDNCNCTYYGTIEANSSIQNKKLPN